MGVTTKEWSPARTAATVAQVAVELLTGHRTRDARFVLRLCLTCVAGHLESPDL